MKEANKILRSTPDDEVFHSTRRMFWIVDGQPVIAALGTAMSHLEMAESKGWVSAENSEDFFNKNPRGFYLDGDNEVRFYKGLGFGFDEELEKKVPGLLLLLKSDLGLKETTKVYLGPKDKVIKGVEYEIKFLGTVAELERV